MARRSDLTLTALFSRRLSADEGWTQSMRPPAEMAAWSPDDSADQAFGVADRRNLWGLGVAVLLALIALLGTGLLSLLVG
jgi:hypothetical protein